VILCGFLTMCKGGESLRGNKEQQQRSNQIDNFIRQDKGEFNAALKLLLLGAGESGKSTFAKQIRILHLNGFSENDRISFKTIIQSNCIGSIRALIEAVKKFDQKLSDGSLEACKRLMDESLFTGRITADLCRDIQQIWKEESIQSVLKRSNEFQLNDSAEYYLKQIERIGLDDYIPSIEDILRSRAKTTGITEIEFSINDLNLILVDVGGQRSERRKWMHCFQEVTAVIFFVALSEYDQNLYEDESTNRMHESLRLFKDICNTKWFEDVDIILFLNKRDLFEKKIGKSPLKKCFEDYQGPNTAEAAAQYIEDQFLAQNENPDKLVYVHRTCATDTENMRVVFNSVVDILTHKKSKE